MAQNRKQSMIETMTSQGIGFGLAYLIWIAIAAVGMMPTDANEGLQVTVIFTVVSVARQFIVRRLFNRIHR